MRSPRKTAAFALQSARDLVDWGRHMWAGMKLLAADVRVSWKVFSKVSQGKAITRRERNFMVQTGVDLARLVPFSLFLIVPLAEFALPFALRLFPNMLPSQFQSQMQKDENLKRQLKANIEIAKFLRDVVEEKAKNIKSSNKDSAIKKEAEELTDFLEAIRSGRAVDVSQVSRFARLFNDELTLDGAVRPQLVAMCRYMGISAHGTDQLLRFRLRSRVNSIKNDDMTITWEGGSNSLTDEEVERACRDRGIRAVGVSKGEMRQQLSDWLDMSQDKAIPASLMIMSRAFLYNTGEDGLKETLSSLPDDVYEDVKMDVSGGDGSNMDRLEEARRQSKLIEMESEREARKDKELAEKKRRIEEELVVGVSASSMTANESVSDTIAAAQTAEHEAKIIAEHFGAVSPSDDARSLKGDADKATTEKKGPPEEDVGDYRPPEGVPAAAGALLKHDEVVVEEKDEEELAKQREAMSRVVDALSSLSAESAIENERKELQDLKNELAVAESVLQSLGAGNESELRRFKSTIRKLETQVDRIDAKLGGRMKLLDLDDDGVMSMAECTDAVKLLADDDADSAAIAQEALRRLDADKDGNISRGDFDRVLKELQVESGGMREAGEDNNLHVVPKKNGGADGGSSVTSNSS
jgi:LETM1 and EF-hand domain-containing protein 1, mitochondrial